MIRILDTKKREFNKKLNYYLNSRKFNFSSKSSVVKKIIMDVKKNQDKSIIKYEKKFNKLKKLNKQNLYFSKSEIKSTIKKLNPNIKRSIDLAFNRILKFHKNQKFKSFQVNDKFKNIFSYRSVPINKVGVYVPGGTASYPSSVLMNCIPALIAGVKEILMTVPSTNGKVNPGVIYAAKKCKVKKIYKLGGAQAVAAFTYGTQTVSKVDKIVGPGNMYVALAKKEVFGEVGIDMFAGPSEVTIIADKFSNPDWVAADLIAQAEHDSSSQSILLTNSKELTFKVKKSINKQLKFLPKKEIVFKRSI